MCVYTKYNVSITKTCQTIQWSSSFCYVKLTPVCDLLLFCFFVRVQFRCCWENRDHDSKVANQVLLRVRFTSDSLVKWLQFDWQTLRGCWQIASPCQHDQKLAEESARAIGHIAKSFATVSRKSFNASTWSVIFFSLSRLNNFCLTTENVFYFYSRKSLRNEAIQSRFIKSLQMMGSF